MKPKYREGDKLLRSIPTMYMTMEKTHGLVINVGYGTFLDLKNLSKDNKTLNFQQHLVYDIAWEGERDNERVETYIIDNSEYVIKTESALTDAEEKEMDELLKYMGLK